VEILRIILESTITGIAEAYGILQSALSTHLKNLDVTELQAKEGE
jgi:hypothetical protein